MSHDVRLRGCTYVHCTGYGAGAAYSSCLVSCPFCQLRYCVFWLGDERSDAVQRCGWETSAWYTPTTLPSSRSSSSVLLCSYGRGKLKVRGRQELVCYDRRASTSGGSVQAGGASFVAGSRDLFERKVEHGVALVDRQPTLHHAWLYTHSFRTSACGQAACEERLIPAPVDRLQTESDFLAQGRIGLCRPFSKGLEDSRCGHRVRECVQSAVLWTDCELGVALVDEQRTLPTFHSCTQTLFQNQRLWTGS